MSATKAMLTTLLCDIYGKQEQQARRLRHCRDQRTRTTRSCGKVSLCRMASGLTGNRRVLEALNIRQLIDVSAMLKVEILTMGYMLERVLIARDRQRRHQEVLCEFVTALFVVKTNDAQPKMRFSLSPPPPKVSVTSCTNSTSTTSGSTIIATSGTNATHAPTATTDISINISNNNNLQTSGTLRKELGRNNNNMISSSSVDTADAAADDDVSDYNQWLHAMKLVARLPGGTPPEFRRKLWLSLADKYLRSKNVDWTQQREKCFCEEWREDDEELGIQIVKDLHRTGSNLCTGPAGSINQAKLKRILLGYARYNPEVGYCQGFNMLGALILQVMDKEEEESMKVMIYLVEGVLPTGYFYGSMGGLQADMSVFRELMQTKLPRLAKHLQRLQGPVENAYEPPLTNVFTMQWFLTMFCTCLPMSCVLRVWDLVLIEGSDVLLRTALVLWSLLEERVLNARTADEFYGKMGSFSNELLNGHLIDSNGLIEKVVQLGPITDIKQLRDKHLYHIAPLGSKQGLQLYFDEDDTHSDDESRMAVATMWGLNWGRRGSVGVVVGGGATGTGKTDQKDRLALDISLLKKQYDRLRERQKQAHVILTTACSTATAAKQTPSSNVPASVVVNQLLQGRPAILTNKGKRIGAPLGAIPPARKPSLPAVLHGKSSVTVERHLRRGETLLWRDTDATRQRRDSLTWKEIKADRAAMRRDGSDANISKSQKLRSRLGKSDSSSYSEDSDGDHQADGTEGSSTDTSLCDDDDPKSIEQSPKRKVKLARKLKEKPKVNLNANLSPKPPMTSLSNSPDSILERKRPKSWAPSTAEIPFMLMGTDSGDEKEPASKVDEEDSATECDRFGYSHDNEWTQAVGDLAYTKMEPLHLEIKDSSVGITSTSQLSPLPDIANYLSTTCISPLPMLKPVNETSKSETECIKPLGTHEEAPETDLRAVGNSFTRFDVNDDGVTNQYFERVNTVERPKRLELSYSLRAKESDDCECEEPPCNEEKTSHFKSESEVHMGKIQREELSIDRLNVFALIRDDNIPGENKDDYKEALSMTIASQIATPPPTPSPTPPPQQLPTTLNNTSRKRRDPRRKTLTRSTTIELEERFLALERCLSQDQTKRYNDQAEAPKHIPTTAALEERYKSLEKQISAEKQKIDMECFEKPERIPSTADLELRFNALSKQMSSNDANAKVPVDLTCNQEQRNDSSPMKSNGSEKTGNLHRSDATTQPVNKISDKSSGTNDNESQSEIKQTRLKKLPSTAELEDRFNALERKISIQTNNPAKSKKEPPDDEIDKGNEQTNKVASPGVINAAKNSGDNKESTKDLEGIVSSQKKLGSDKMKTPETTEDSQEFDLERRKAPPSTEELEKRFKALEKQISISNVEPNDNEKGNSPKSEGERKTGIQKSKVDSAFEKEEKAFKTMKSSSNISKENKEIVELEAKKTDIHKRAKKILESEELPKAIENTTNSDTDTKSKPTHCDQSQRKELSKRRASEPPSMEDLEKRYETLKRRMSSKNHLPTQNETVIAALERIEQEIIAEMGDTAEEQRPIKKEPPSTEDLESRYDALHCQDKVENEKLDTSKNEISDSAKTIKMSPQHVDVAIEAHIPEAPPPPTGDHKIHIDPGHHQQRALIEELQRRMQGQSPGEDNLKPSEINPQRKHLQQQRQMQLQLQQRPTPMGDETSEAPANTAYYRSGNYEPWQTQRMVRRFSDLPSRADLENRLQFLERKLYKKFYKQRCASDSEVASRTVRLNAHDHADDEKPSTSRQAEAHLEQRVLALEKQLSENSLKLLDAMREKEQAKEQLHAHSDNIHSPLCHLGTDTETGKELVRYTQNFSEMEDSDKPINISINIKMLVNKEGELKRPMSESEPESTTEDLKRRLEQLELQLVEERARNETILIECDLATEDGKPFSKPIEQLTDATKKLEKESHNHNVKSDEDEKLEKEVESEKKMENLSDNHSCKSNKVEKLEAVAKLRPEQDCHNHNVKPDESDKLKEFQKPSADSTEPETMKESKTLQNEEKAQSRSKESDLDKTNIKDEKVVNREIDKNENTSSLPKKQEVLTPPARGDEVVEKSDIIDDEPSACEENNVSHVIDATNIEGVDSNNKTVVLLMDNEPKALKVRRLTRANTEELEGLFQALEKQLNDRNLVKSKDGKLVRAESKPSAEQMDQAQAISDLTKEITDFTSSEPEADTELKDTGENKQQQSIAEQTTYDWGPNPVKHHLKRKTVYLPSTKELEARFRSLERQIKLLEDVEKIDVEQRLVEIERKIKLQYSLSHEKDLNKYIELCEGKGLDIDEDLPEEPSGAVESSRSPSRKETKKSPYTSPVRKVATKSPHISPSRKARSPYVSPSRKAKSPLVSPSRHTGKVLNKNEKSPYTSPARQQVHHDDVPISDDLEYKYRVLDLVRSKSKDNLSKRQTNKKPPIHPLEMLLDPSPDDSEIPTTGELEHRIRLLDEKLKSPGCLKSRSRSPTIDDIKRKKILDEQRPKTPVHSLERLVSSPSKPVPPTAAELDERIRALEEEQRFDFKTQKVYKEFNQKLKDVVSPSLSYEEFKASKSREQSPKRQTLTTPKSALRRDEHDDYRRGEETTYYRPTSPKVIRFRDEDEDYYEENRRSKCRPSPSNDRMKTFADHPADEKSASRTPVRASSSEGVDALGSRLMRETSPITRTGTHTGVPLRTGDNINERLSSIKNSIKSIDSLCEEKPYQKEKCQRYIDSLFTDSLHFASKKSSAEDLTHSQSDSRGRGRGQQRCSDYTPSIRISSEHRSAGSVESVQMGISPLRGASPPHYRSHRDISRELSPRRGREAEEQEERESSRVRRDNMLPNYFVDNRSELSSCNSLTKFHKVDRQLEETCAKYADDRRSASRSPLSSPYESRTSAGTRYNNNSTSHSNNTTTIASRPISPYRQPQPHDLNHSMRSNTPVYQPTKLEIRHTTVTSTFYDRFLTERKIEKQTLSRPPSRSPVISPSATTKSYTNLADTPLTVDKYSCNAMIDLVTTTNCSLSTMSRSYAGSSSHSYLTPLVSSGDREPISIPSTCTANSFSNAFGQTTASSSSFTFSSTASTTASTFVSTSNEGTLSAFVPYNFSSSFSSRLSEPTPTSAVSTSSLSSSTQVHSYSTGVYNPMMSFTLREPLISKPSPGSGSILPSPLLGQYQYKGGFSSTYSSSAVDKSEIDKP
ncbi:uncharacterized protein LOC132786836 isoform X1 [Drosophila nasuta]|uniref:uncharacterized protein LOC132786836 isoform X1 n=2 Tax=Drosophila nasuta TaxID=42062 RepID=UPI00295EE7C6|nr:uncharacterized protein LOC132786836 isoform X1 [Drosophila nasuta]